MLPMNSASAALMRRRRSNSSLKAAMYRPGGYASGSSLAIFAVSRCMRVVGVIAAVELLTHLPVVVFCFLTLFFASCVVVALQRPWAATKRLTRQQWLRVLINGVFYGVVWLLWAKGLQESGALRTVILEHSHVAIVALVGACVQGLGKSAKGAASARRRAQARGEMLFLAGFVCLFYHSVDMSQMPWLGEEAHKPMILKGTHANDIVGDGNGGADADESSSEMYEELGLAWGLVLLVVSSLLGAVRGKFASKVAKDIGGAKRLHALSLSCCALMLMPVMLIDFLGEAVVGVDYDYSVLSGDTLLKSLLVALLVLVLQFYSAAIGQTYIAESTGTLLSLIVSFACTFVLTHFDIVRDGSLLDHERHYTPLVAAWALTAAGLWELLSSGGYSSGNAGDGSFGGENGASSFAARPYANVIYDSHDAPLAFLWRKFSQLVLGVDDLDGIFTQMPQLYWTSSEAKAGGGSGVGKNGGSSTYWSVGFFRRIYAHIMGSPDSRKIAIFLLLNVLFMFVEIAVGLWTNSLGLISDAGHMFFDTMALLIGLFASFVSVWKPDANYTYGYTRFETICGFVNGVFLVFIAVFIMTESIERLSEPPELSTQGLLTTSVLGFLVNMVGLVFFHDHAHIGSGHDGCAHAHSHGGNENLHGVFLHILADALGSLGVIVSSLLIEYKGWYIADPLCSLMISVLILLAVYPLLKSTSQSLLLINSPGQARAFNEVLREIMFLDGVVGIREPHLFAQGQAMLVVSLHVITLDGFSEQAVTRTVEDVVRKRLPLTRHLTVMTYQTSTYYDICQRCALPPPLFWDYGTGTLVFSQDGLLTPEQKRQQQEQARPSFYGHAGGWGAGAVCHGHSHGQVGHEHSHSSYCDSHNQQHGHSHQHPHPHSVSRNVFVDTNMKEPVL